MALQWKQYSGKWNLQTQGQAEGAGNWPKPFNYLWAWGDGGDGRLGLGNTTDYSSPVQVGAANWSSIASGTSHTLALHTDGTVWAWGDNSNGTLGLGNTTDYSSPKQVGSLTDWAFIAAGGHCSFAGKTDGTLWSWGYGAGGQLGQNNTTAYSSPVQIGALTTWSSITGFTVGAMAVKTDGTLWGWGDNYYGRLGQGDSGDGTDRSSPVQVGALTTWATIGGTYNFTFAIKTDGTLWAWGRNYAGQLGIGNTTDYSSPVQVGALTDWAIIDAGDNMTTAIKTDGTMWSMGQNNHGQLGNSPPFPYPSESSPVQIGALTSWSAIACGTEHTLAVRTDGTFWSWGYNNIGQLGINKTSYYGSPRQIGALTNWATPSARYVQSFALTT